MAEDDEILTHDAAFHSTHGAIVKKKKIENKKNRHPKVPLRAVPGKHILLERLYRENYERYKHVRYRFALEWPDLGVL